MNFRMVFRHVADGIKNVGRNGWMSFAAVSAVAVTLFILGVFLFLAMNINNIAKTVEQQVEVRAFAELDVTDDQLKAIESALKAMPEVKHVQYISKEDGLNQLKRDLGDSRLLEGLETNPLPDSFRVKTIDPEKSKQVAAKIEQLDGVEKAEYGEAFTDTLFRVTKTVRNVGIVLIVMLGLTSMFLISNTIRLTIIARRREIEIMKLVGATNWFIRWPFFIEGMLIGLIGATVPALLLTFGYYSLATNVMDRFELWFIDMLPAYPLVFEVMALLLAIGAIIGAAGSFLSLRRFLKI